MEKEIRLSGIMKKLVSLLILLVAFEVWAQNSVAPDVSSQLPSAREFLDMDLDSAFKLIAGLNKEEAKVLSNQILLETRKEYPKAENFYYLISHVEEIKAVKKEENRLWSLISVYVIALVLFGGFLGYVLLKQRKNIRELNEILKRENP